MGAGSGPVAGCHRSGNGPRELDLVHISQYGISGLMIALMATFGQGDVIFDPPRAVRVVSVDRSPLRLEALRLDRSGIHTREGLVPWESIRPREAGKLWLKVMRRDRGEDWLDAAWVLLIHPEADQEDRRMAARFLAEATRRLPDGEERITQLQSEVVDWIEAREARLSREAAAVRRQLGPEAWQWNSDPWPDDDQAEELRRSSDLEGWLNQRLDDIAGDPGATQAGMRRFRKSRHALLASDQPRGDLMSIGLQADDLFRELNELFGLESDERIFAPRLAILVCSQSGNHEQVVRTVFGRPIEPVSYEPVGPTRSDLVMTVDGADITSVMPALRHQLVHAWMHRMSSPRRPPAWFNEGLAHAFAWWRSSPSQQPWRAEAIAYLRQPGVAESLLSRPYAPGHWTLDGVDTAAAGLVVARLLEEQPAQIADWIRRIKRGEQVEDAYKEAMGVMPSESMARHLRYWMLND